MKTGFIAATGLLVTLSLPALAAAKCPASADLEQRAINSEAIVYGKVVALEALDGDKWKAEVEVVRAYKGKYDEEDIVEVYTSGHQDIDFQRDQSIMVYANQAKGDRLDTGECNNPVAMEEAPIAAETSSFFATPPGKAPLEIKARRASAIFVGEVTAAGRGFAGRWDGVTLQVKVKKAIKGTKRNAKVRVRLDEDTCGGGKKRNLLSDDDLKAGDARAPYEVKQQYLFYTFDEAPYEVLLCHDNMQPVAAAEDDLSLLATMCKKKRCQSGHDAVNRQRLGVKKSVEDKAKSSLQMCAKELPLYSKAGAITDLELSVSVRPDGIAELLNVSSRGTLEDGAVYDGLGQCFEQKIGQWGFDAVEGRPDLEATVKMQMKDSSRGPKYEHTSVNLSAR